MLFLLCLHLFLCFHWTEGQIAKSSYFMDSRSDCYLGGYLLIPTGSVVNINSRNPVGGDSDILSCTYRFKPQDSGAVTDVRFSSFTLSDCDITLRVDLSGANSYTLGCKDSQPNPMTADDGLATVTLTKRTIDDKDYSFALIIRAYRKDNTLVQDESPVAIGLIVGIVGGIIGFLILVVIMIVCCYRKKKRYLRARAESEHTAGLTYTVSPAHSYGYDVKDPKQRVDVYDDDTPSSKKKLLMSQSNRGMDPRDQSESESETKDKEPDIIRQLNKSPSKTAALNFENDRMRRGTQGQGWQSQPIGKKEEPVIRSEEKENGSQSSSLLSALHNNPRFRASFHFNEADAEERAQRISQSSVTNETGSDSAASGSWNTSFDTQLSEDDRPKGRSIPKPPPLPPVPMSPRAQTRSQNTATIRRAPRPSSSTSDIVQLQNDSEDGDVGIRKVNPQPDPPSPSEIVPIRIKDTQHTLRPDRARKTPEEKNQKGVQSASEMGREVKAKEDFQKQSKPEKPAKHDSKTNTSQDPRTNKAEKSSRPPDGRAGPNLEPEGRFKKATNTRKKTNTKSPRIGRSRSTGSALDELESLGRSGVPNYKVPEVTADDYEDSDVESNYNPLRRTGSKNSLYASRSSLYGRRRRRSSISESVASAAYDDMDYPESDRFSERRLSRRDRAFKSLGDLESEMRDHATRSTQTLRECATQTGTGFANVSPGKKTVVKRSKPKSVRSSTTQTAKSHERKGSASSTSGLTKNRERKNSASSTSGISKPRERKNSASSTSGISKPRERKNSTSSNSGKPKKPKNEAEKKAAPSGRQETQKPETKPKPKVKPRKSTAQGTDSGNEVDGDGGMTDQSSVITNSTAAQSINPATLGQPMYPTQVYPPPYSMGYPPHLAYATATGQPPVMMPPPPQPGMHPVYGNVVMPSYGMAPQGASTTVPNLAAQPKGSKWEQLCRMTGAESGTVADSFETGSVAGSVFSNPASNNPYSSYSFNTLQSQPPPAFSASASDYYAGSERSVPRSGRAPSEASHRAGLPSRSSWDTLKEMTERQQNISFASQGSDSPPSESNV